MLVVLRLVQCWRSILLKPFVSPIKLGDQTSSQTHPFRSRTGPTRKHWRNIETFQGRIGKCLGLWRHEMIDIRRICSWVSGEASNFFCTASLTHQCLGATAMAHGTKQVGYPPSTHSLPPTAYLTAYRTAYRTVYNQPAGTVSSARERDERRPSGASCVCAQRNLERQLSAVPIISSMLARKAVLVSQLQSCFCSLAP